MTFYRLRKRAQEVIASGFLAPPTEDQLLALFDKLTPEEQGWFVSLPVIVSDFNFDVPDAIYEAHERLKADGTLQTTIDRVVKGGVH